MQQVYHSNAVKNLHIRNQIKNIYLTNSESTNKYNISTVTVNKWKNRDVFTDLSSAPNNIKYALNCIEQSLIVSIRKTAWLPLDEVWEMLLVQNPGITRSSVYRTFCRNNINKIPQEKREKAKSFKEYEPGYLHIDVTYLPKLEGTKYYLFVAIDRATRTLFYEVYDAKTNENAENFMNKCLLYFPFGITHVLTDNGLEFTNRLIKSKKNELCTKLSKLDVLCKEDMILSLNTFLIHYMFYRRHGGLRKELNVKTPFDAIEKWYQLKPELFIQNPLDFKDKLLTFNQHYYYTSFYIQPCET